MIDPAYISTHSGLLVNVTNLDFETIDVQDIAHALSNLCRFGGHCKSFYSVAQHSVYVSYMMPQGKELAGLLHDASEAYLVDMPRPLKNVIPDYMVIEDRIQATIAVAFGLSVSAFDDADVKMADDRLLAMEAAVLVKHPENIWKTLGRPDYTMFDLDRKYRPWSPQESKDAFLGRYMSLRFAPEG